MLTKYKAIDIFRKLEKQQAREKGDEELSRKPDIKETEQEFLKKERRNDLLFAISCLAFCQIAKNTSFTHSSIASLLMFERIL